VLVTESAASALASYKEAAWLVKRNPISLLPSVASLRSLRAYAKPSKAPKPFLGFGNPLLDGDPAQRPWEAKWAKIAREKQACSSAPPHKTAGAGTRQLGPSLIATRSGRADVAHIKAQTPLYETADELCEVAASLGAAAEDVRLGARATEKAVRELSAANRLADYRILHFATHGILAAESRWLMHESAKREWSFKPQTAEPGLILTPPEAATREEDGLLAMSEIAELNLDADWAVLSACNTAGGANIGDSEAFSGLASAFLYAGARAVLASQWYVDSRAAVKITTETFRSLSSEPSAGRAEALRRAILAAMTDPDRTKEEGPADHPSVWGPFVLVGEGGAGR
jgi:CHAT domain-containing protein